MRTRQEVRLLIRIGLIMAVGPSLGSSVMAQFGAPPAVELQLDRIQLPPGFSIDLYTRDVPDARSMTLGSEGTLFVGTRREGAVYAVVDRDGDQKGDQVLTLAKEMSTPNGVAFPGIGATAGDSLPWVRTAGSIYRWGPLATSVGRRMNATLPCCE